METRFKLMQLFNIRGRKVYMYMCIKNIF